MATIDLALNEMRFVTDRVQEFHESAILELVDHRFFYRKMAQYLEELADDVTAALIFPELSTSVRSINFAAVILEELANSSDFIPDIVEVWELEQCEILSMMDRQQEIVKTAALLKYVLARLQEEIRRKNIDYLTPGKIIESVFWVSDLAWKKRGSQDDFLKVARSDLRDVMEKLGEELGPPLGSGDGGLGDGDISMPSPYKVYTKKMY